MPPRVAMYFLKSFLRIWNSNAGFWLKYCPSCRKISFSGRTPAAWISMCWQKPETDRSIVAHGMNPVPLMPGVEVVPGTRTSAEAIEFTRKTLLEMKKVPFLAPNIPGFWVNRLLFPQMLDAIRLLEVGLIQVEDGDAGLNTCLGHPQGAFKLYDFASTPTILRVALEMYKASNDPRFYPPLILMRMVKNKEFGAGSGKGFYDWSDPRNPRPRKLAQYIISNAENMTGAMK